VVHENPYPAALNGALWTLRYEIGCYVLIGVSALVPALWRYRTVTLAALVSSTLLALALLGSNDSPSALREALQVVPYFFAGATLYRYRNVVPSNGWLALLSVGWIFLATGANHGLTMNPAPVAYLAIWLGNTLPAAFRKIGATNDVSYGVYIYAFPLQQLIASMRVQHMGVFVFTSASLAVTFPVAWLSWLLIERPANALKPITRKRHKHGAIESVQHTVSA
jgi:peptidoglycan/LPS O-acetylase OafA/YrhL